MRRASFLLFMLLILSMTTLCYGQWKKAIQFPDQVRSVYFLDQIGYSEIGFVGLYDGELWRTQDGGNTWQHVFDEQGSISISDFTFKDSLNGWFTSFNGAKAGFAFIYQTFDGGIHWQQTIKGNLFSAIYYQQFSHTLLYSDWNSGGFSSSDDGAIWNQYITQTPMNGYAFSDSLNGIITFAGTNSTALLTTSDGGLNWQLQTIIYSGAWQPAGKPGTITFFMFSEYTNSLLRSDDAGLTWNTISTLSVPKGGLAGKEFTGCLRLNSCSEVFVQSTSVGFFSSTDEGISWQGIAGPSNEVDSRFWIKGNDVFAGDFAGGFWMYHSTPVTQTPFTPQLSATQSINKVFLQPGKDTTLIFSVSNDIPSATGLDSMNFDLHFNPDMLNLDSVNAAAGKKITIRQVQSGWYSNTFYNISHSDITANQPLAFFHFSSYLTKDTISSVVLKAGNVFFDPVKHAGCIIETLPSDDSVIIQAADTCADKSLRNFLATGNIDFRIISIRPNPTSNEIAIETQSPSLQEVNIIIYDELGRKYFDEMRSIQWRTTLTLPIGSLSAGLYHLMLKSASGSVSSDFVKLL